MPFKKGLKNDSDLEDLMMYELVNMFTMNFADQLSKKYHDDLFDYYMRKHAKHLDDKESFPVQCFIQNLIEESDQEQRAQLVYDSIEDDADEFIKGILTNISTKDETFNEMMDRINDASSNSVIST